MVRIDPDPFLNELTKLFEKNRSSGTVWVTLKRSNLKPTRKRKKGLVATEEGGSEASAEEDESSHRCLVRATDGKRKFSTTVSAKDHQRFQAAYATVLKAHMDALKKKDKKDKKKLAGKPATGS